MAQFARPASDVTINAFTPTPLWEQINEVTANDADLIRSPNDPAGATCMVGLSAVTDPEVGTGHMMRFRYRQQYSGGGSPGNCAFETRLYDGATLIRTHFVPALANNDTAWYTDVITLTESEANAITNYGDLRLELWVNKVSGAKTTWGEISWAELEVPDAPSGEVNLTTAASEQTAEASSSALAQTHALSGATSIGTLAIPDASLDQTHALTTEATTGALAIPDADLSVAQSLEAAISEQPAVSIAAPLKQTHVATSEPSTQAIEAPGQSLNQAHDLSAGVTSGSSTIPNAEISQGHALSSEPTVGALEIPNASVGAAKDLTASTSTLTPATPNAILNQTQVLTAEVTSGALAIPDVSIGNEITLSTEPTVASFAVLNVAITGTSILASEPSIVAAQIPNVNLNQGYVLATEIALAPPEILDAALVQQHALVASISTGMLAIPSVSMTTLGKLLAPSAAPVDRDRNAANRPLERNAATSGSTAASDSRSTMNAKDQDRARSAREPGG